MNEIEAVVQWHQGIFKCEIWYQNMLLGLIGKSSKASKEGRNVSKANGLG
jgi:hypothetical protein